MSIADLFWKSDKPKKEETIDLDAPEQESKPSRGAPKRVTLGAAQTPAPSAPLTSLTIPLGTVAGAPDPEIVKTLEAAVAESTTQEYTQFRAIFETLSALPDVQRYPTAISVAAVSKITGPAILKAMDARIQRTDKERELFEQYATATEQEQVAKRHAEASDLDQQIAAKAREIEEMSKRKNALVQDAAAAAATLNQQRATFAASLDVVRNNLTAERDRIAPFVTPNTPTV